MCGYEYDLEEAVVVHIGGEEYHACPKCGFLTEVEEEEEFEESIDCVYDLVDECVDPWLRGEHCFECPVYQNALENVTEGEGRA